jgi:hypothetical protein
MIDFDTHFDDDAWYSFVRGILPTSGEQAIRAHLERGCAECQRTHEIWKRVVETAGRDGSDSAADSADSLSKAVFGLRRRIPFRAGLALLAEPLFDSSQDPAPMGIRGSASGPRQLVYEAGGYLIDLQLEQQVGGPGALVGQVVHAWAEGATRGTEVVLVRENSVVGQTVANSIGEFQFDCDYSDDLKICLGISGDTFIEVLLPNASSGPSPTGTPEKTTAGDSEPGKKLE